MGSRELSDHCLIWIKGNNYNWGAKSFKVFSCWFHHPGLLLLVENVWNSIMVYSKDAFVFKENFKVVEGSLRCWNKKVFGLLDLSIDVVLNEFNALDLEDANVLNSGFEDLACKRSEASIRVWHPFHEKESMLRQKARHKWILEGGFK